MPRILNFIPISCMEPRNLPEDTHWFFNQLWCARTCACISNLNYAHKGDTCPPRTTSLLEKSSNLQEAYTKICSYSANFLPRHGTTMTWHHAKFHDFKTNFSMFSTEPRCPDVWILFSFFSWDRLPPSIYKIRGAAYIVSHSKVACSLLEPRASKSAQFFYHNMLVPWHDTMPSFLNTRRVLDLHEFKSKASRCSQPSHDAQMFQFHSRFFHGT